MYDNKDIFVRINYKIKGTGRDMKCSAKINYINAEDAPKYMLGSGYCIKNVCSFVFKAKNLEEAKLIAQDNAILKNWLQKYNSVKYDLIVTPGF